MPSQVPTFEIKRILKKYHEQFCAHRFGNFRDMGQFLKRKIKNPLNSIEFGYLNNPTSIKKSN
jgi:hypothetical protein